MAAERIEYVWLKDGTRASQIALETMTKVFFKANKELIYCPNPLCNANIEYCEGPNRVFFRTKRSKINGEEIIEQHIEDCPFGIEHQSDNGPKVIYDPNIGFLISDNHVLESMKRAYNQYVENGKGDKEKGNKGKGKKRNNEVNINTKSEDVVVKGKGVLGKQDNAEKAPREPNLYQRFIDDISKKDFGNPRLVKGVVSGINYELNSITITLNTADGRTARMHFSEDFKVNNESQFIQMGAYKRFFDFKNLNKQEAFIICAGDVTNDNYDISVQVRSYTHIFIDGMTHNELINFINKFID
jgi:hypothetical protein